MSGTGQADRSWRAAEGWADAVERVELRGAGYAVRDSGGGPETVLLLHGWPDDGRLWRHQVAPLAAAGYRVLAPDLLGFGESDWCAELERYSAPALAEDILSLARARCDGPLHLVAHDWGAVVGWEMATQAPEALASFVPISVGHMGALLQLDHAKLANLWYFLLSQAPQGAEALLAGDGRLLGFYLASHPEGAALTARLVAEPARLQAMRRIELAHPVDQLLAAALGGDLPPPAPVRVPTLAIWGREDCLMGAAQIRDSRAFVAAPWRYLALPRAGHWLMLERPERLTRALLAWFRAHPAGAAAG